MMRARVYLDWNGSSPLLPEAKAAMEAVLNQAQGAGLNASAVHGAGRAARQIVDEARAQIARAVRAKPAEVIFTSGGSEANALALRGAIEAAAMEGQRFTRLFVSAIEHDSVRAWAAHLAETVPGLRVDVIPVTRAGVVDLDALAVMLREGKGRTLISVMLANNETGAIQPVARVAEMAREYGATVHTDAAQALGRVDVDFAALGVHMMTLSAHKAGGPLGAGALVVRDDVKLAPQIRGGGQESFKRAGTENVVALAGFGAAAAHRGAPEKMAVLRDAMEAAILARVPGTVIHARGVPRLPNTSLIGHDGLDAETQVMAMDLAGFCVSAGAACSSGKVRPSHVLSAMGLSEDAARSAIRVSIGATTTRAELDQFVDAYVQHVARAAHLPMTAEA